MPRLPKVRTAFSLLSLAVLLACALGQHGCYHRVVGARGLGASNYDISEPYQENSKLDDWIFGERKANDKIIRPTAQ
jgi:hypothetical protein